MFRLIPSESVRARPIYYYFNKESNGKYKYLALKQLIAEKNLSVTNPQNDAEVMLATDSVSYQQKISLLLHKHGLSLDSKTQELVRSDVEQQQNQNKQETAVVVVCHQENWTSLQVSLTRAALNQLSAQDREIYSKQAEAHRQTELRRLRDQGLLADVGGIVEDEKCGESSSSQSSTTQMLLAPPLRQYGTSSCSAKLIQQEEYG